LTLLAEYDNSNYVEKREAHCGDNPRAETAVPPRAPEEMKGEQG
jgi:hypothetical protein